MKETTTLQPVGGEIPIGALSIIIPGADAEPNIEKPPPDAIKPVSHSAIKVKLPASPPNPPMGP